MARIRRSNPKFAAASLNLYMMKQCFLFLFALGFAITTCAQSTHAINDPELQYKEAKEFIIKEQYALAYPLVKSLLEKYPENRVSDFTYLREDVLYFEE